jgi:hypothetical protein
VGVRGRWEVRGGRCEGRRCLVEGGRSCHGETDFSQEQRGRSRGAEHSRAQQSRAASTATMRTSTISSPSENCVKGSATPPDCPPHIVPTEVLLPQQHLQVCTLTAVASNLTPPRLTPHIFQQNSPLPPANSRRAQGSGWHTVQDTAADPPCNVLPARHSVLDLF